MNFAAFSYAYSTNLGDEIQTLAATQYLPRVDVLLERDRLHWYRSSTPTFVIFNGWFIEQPSWPPPDSVCPLFVSFHAARPETLISESLASYFKRHEPIGCRSLATMQAFHRVGVDAYFSGCLTLTLQRRPVPRTDQIYAVDVDPHLFAGLVPPDVKQRVMHLSHEFPPSDATLATRAKWNAAYFGLRGMQKWDSGRPLWRGAAGKLNNARHSFRISRAEELLAMYSAAQLVITSRLHCAMPCLALGTPVILLRPGVESDPRFAGLRELVRVHSDFSQPLRVDWHNPEPNSDSYLRYANALRERCQAAVGRVLAREEDHTVEQVQTATPDLR